MSERWAGFLLAGPSAEVVPGPLCCVCTTLEHTRAHTHIPLKDYQTKFLFSPFLLVTSFLPLSSSLLHSKLVSHTNYSLSLSLPLNYTHIFLLSLGFLFFLKVSMILALPSMSTLSR